MSHPSSVLGTLLAPTSVESFLAEVWGRAHLLLPGPDDRFANLLPWSELNRILREHRFESGRLRLAASGEVIPASRYLDGNGQVKAQELTALLRGGATLNINSVHEMHEPVARLTESLEDTLHESVQVNLYASWRRTNGFDLHWDGHDVFAVQVDGRKFWGIYGSTMAHPVRGDASETVVERPTEPLWEGLLTAGDVLYLPRGCWHVATSQDEPSLHLSFGVRQQTGVDFLRWVANRALASEHARADLPRMADEDARRAHVGRLREEIVQAVTLEALDEFLGETDARADVRPVLSLPWTATEDGIPPSDWRVRLIPVRGRIVDRGNGKVTLVAGGRRWSVVAPLRPILERLLQREWCDVDELAETVDVAVARDDLRRLLGKMVHGGLLAVEPGVARPGTVEEVRDPVGV